MGGGICMPRNEPLRQVVVARRVSHKKSVYAWKARTLTHANNRTWCGPPLTGCNVLTNACRLYVLHGEYVVCCGLGLRLGLYTPGGRIAAHIKGDDLLPYPTAPLYDILAKKSTTLFQQKSLYCIQIDIYHSSYYFTDQETSRNYDDGIDTTFRVCVIVFLK